MENEKPQATTWPDLAIALYDRLTERHSEITYELENLEVTVPSSAGGEATSAKWVINGAMKIRARNDAN